MSNEQGRVASPFAALMQSVTAEKTEKPAYTSKVALAPGQALLSKLSTAQLIADAMKELPANIPALSLMAKRVGHNKPFELAKLWRAEAVPNLPERRIPVTNMRARVEFISAASSRDIDRSPVTLVYLNTRGSTRVAPPTRDPVTHGLITPPDPLLTGEVRGVLALPDWKPQQ